MDGSQSKKLNHSLRFRLVLRLSLLVLCFGLVAGVLAFNAMMHRAMRLIDSDLIQAASFFDAHNVSLSSVRRKGGHKFRALPFPVSALDRSGLSILGTDTPDGLHTVNTAKETWRVLVFTRESGERFVVAVPERLRLRLAWQNALEIVLPYMLLMLCLIGGIIVTVRSVIRPIQKMALTLDARDEQDAHPLETAILPTEIQPFCEAINRLLARVAASLSMQRKFVADAAHELRSPVAALLLQAERLAQADLAPEAASRLQVMRNGLRRAQVLVEQMLAMARVQERQFGLAEPFSVKDLVAELLEDIFPQAEAKNIDLGLLDGEDIRMTAPVMAVGLALKNLLENAIRYTPEHGAVDLHIFRKEQNVIFRVSDTGPGIPEQEREHVFIPFYRSTEARTPGSGLGLAIVKAVVAHLGGDIALGHANPSTSCGLLVTVRLPG